MHARMRWSDAGERNLSGPLIRLAPRQRPRGGGWVEQMDQETASSSQKKRRRNNGERNGIIKNPIRISPEKPVRSRSLLWAATIHHPSRKKKLLNFFYSTMVVKKKKKKTEGI
jgi:hypothetical protein